MDKITSKTLLKIYLYVILTITLTAMLFSGAYIIKAAASYITPIPFSYTLYTVNDRQEMEDYNLQECEGKDVVYEFEGNRYCWNNEIRKEGLINSSTIFGSMLILFLLHLWGLKQSKATKTPEWLIKGYTFLSLLIYSVTGVIAIPTSIYLVANYFLTEVETYSTQYAPTYALGLVFLTLPLWYIFFKKTNNLKD